MQKETLNDFLDRVERRAAFSDVENEITVFTSCRVVCKKGKKPEVVMVNIPSTLENV